ncbi:hypothetical protein UFOVP459_26 [uncultured Caudovirales phage]|uniref:Uncharacterized protein n=1 Tax=uncultured Caudovirales phage TaxID=2100421 RepID=A0A6J5SF17_9CAUD|nr:hypothetical protein UFOVP459_26 [uncultured Caudovirales phage]CAB4183409.1 hypothetical protein UFOVP1089_59 [uncultured Caudovirales phage]CAB4212279.1 hypothetical protein UFOVP1443_2 [uncultured Caudovirales phage]
MTFGPFPAVNTNAIQQDFLERAFQESLQPVFAYRHTAKQEDFPARIGESLTKTRPALMVPNTTPLDPTTNTNIDNGLTPTVYGTEQYTLSVLQYAQTSYPVNLMDDERTIASFYIRNAKNLGVAQGTAIDSLAQRTLFNAYMGGQTFVTVTLGAPSLTVQVDDIRGFQFKMVNGVFQPVSPANLLNVVINGVTLVVSAAAADLVNVSSAAITGGISGVLTFTTLVPVIDGTAGNYVNASNSSVIIRPNGRLSTRNLVTTDLFTLDVLLEAVTTLRNNNVHTFEDTGRYHCIVDPTTMGQIFRDPAFQLLYRGQGLENTPYKTAYVSQALDVMFFQSTQAYVQAPAGTLPPAVTVHRPIVCGQDCLIESVFTTGLNAVRENAKVGKYEDDTGFVNDPAWGVMSERSASGGSYMYVRPPIDRLGQIVTQTASYIGGFTAPTDSLTTPAVIGTATNSDYKRAVIIETA